MEINKKTVLITGASSGFGLATANHLAGQGYKVFGTTRKTPAAPVNSSLSNLQMIVMDATQPDSIQAAVTDIITQTGRIDVVINNAGMGICGAVELTTPEEARAQFDVNFFGVVQVCQTVLPFLRKQGSGRIINISSLGGLIGLPCQGFYSASKFALEGITEALYQELHPLGIKVVLIEPGDFQTSFTANRHKIKHFNTEPDYRLVDQALSVIEHDENNGSDPQRIARLIGRIISRHNPHLRYKIGAADQILAPLLKNILPAKLFARIIAGHYGL